MPIEFECLIITAGKRTLYERPSCSVANWKGRNGMTLIGKSFEKKKKKIVFAQFIFRPANMEWTVEYADFSRTKKKKKKLKISTSNVPKHLSRKSKSVFQRRRSKLPTTYENWREIGNRKLRRFKNKTHFVGKNVRRVRREQTFFFFP